MSYRQRRRRNELLNGLAYVMLTAFIALCAMSAIFWMSNP